MIKDGLDMKNKTITIVGSYNVGLFLKGQRLPETGETITADKFHEGPGGKGSNQAIAAAMFGADVKFIGRLGNDNYGKDALSMYKKVGISTGLITIDDTIHSGISVILIDKDGRNMISVALGANLRLSPADIDHASGEMEKSFLVGFQLENNLETVLHGIRKVHGAGVATFLDPAPAVRLPGDIYPCIDIIKPNETEASILSGIKVAGVADAEQAGRWFLEQGVGKAIITLGDRGAVVVSRDLTRHFPAPKVQAVDSTGAGDIFSGAFLSSLAAGRPIEDAIKYASAAAAISTTRLGVIESIPARDEVDAMLAKGW
jgi:ribokinase